VTTAERNQVLGQSGDVYERYYTPTNTGHDFQAICFGTPSEEELIQSVASMGLSRDKRAPKELTDAQRKHVQEDPSLVALRNERAAYKQQLKAQGNSLLSITEKELLRKKYEQTGHKIVNVRQRILRLRLKEVIREFHDSIDTIEIAKQLNGKEAREAIMLPAIEFEFPERGIIAALLFKPASTEQIRIKFVYAMARLFKLRETRSSKATKRTATKTISRTCGSSTSARPTEIAPSPKKRKTSLDGKLLEQGRELSGYEDMMDVQLRYLYPIVPGYQVCGFCYGNKQLSHEGRTKRWPRKDVLRKHVNTHFRDDECRRCPFPSCHVFLGGEEHYWRHSLEVHNVAH
jgi:hypothetical protein